MRHLLSVCCLIATAAGQAVIGDVVATDATVKGEIVFAGGGTRVLSGSSVTAGAGTASLHLARGGEVRVCANTNLMAATAPNNRDLSLGFSTGALELNYPLGPSSDQLQTPDFRIALVGPATFHLAVAADAHGDTCVRPLPGNTGAIIVHELMGDGVYQVHANEVAIFRGGKVSERARELLGECGCPAPAPVQMAKTAAPPATPAATPPDAPAPPPAADGSQLHVEVDTPIVFNARRGANAATAAPPAAAFAPPVAPAPTENMLAAVSSLARWSAAERPLAVIVTPPIAAKPTSKGFGARLRSFFARMFGGK
jgi:hypothetical protein